MRKVLVVAFVVGVAALGCKKKEKRVAPFRVVLTSPASGEKGVPIDTLITIQFSLPVDTATLSGNFSVEDSSGASVSGATSWAADDTLLTFTPSANLNPSTKYTVRLTSQIKSRTGRSLAAHTFSFTTGTAAATNPYVVATTPPDGVSDVPFNKRLKMTVYFSRDMDNTTITSTTVLLESAAGAVTLNVTQLDAKTYQFEPQSDLSAGTRYTLRVTTGCQDTGGNPLASEYTATFKMVDITPVSVEVPAGTSNPAGYVNSATASAATLRVTLASGIRSGDTVSVSATDTTNTVTDKASYTSNPQDFTLDLSALSDGALTLEAWVVRYGVEGERVTGSAQKDTVAPTHALNSPSSVPQFFTLSTLTLWFDVDEAGLLEAEVTDGAAQVVTASATAAGTVRIDIPLYIASRNDITVRFTDNAGNTATPLTYTVYHRGGVRKVATSQELKVWVYDWHTLEPIEDAVVVLGDTAAYAQTDADGLATFNNITAAQTVTVYYPPSYGHARYGKAIITAFEVEPGCVSLPLGFDPGNALVTVQGTITNPPTAGRPYAQPSEDWTDDDITDGDYGVLVPANRFVAFSFFGMDTTTLLPDRHAFLLLEPQASASTVTQDVTMPASAETPDTIQQADVGTLTVPSDFMLQDEGQGHPPVFTFVAARIPNVESPAICGWGTFPTSPSGTTFTYSTTDIDYFQWDGADEYFVGVYARDIFNREFRAFARSATPPTAAPDLAFLEEPEVIKPAHGACPATLTPEVQVTSVLSKGFYLVHMESPENETEWSFVLPHTLTTFTVPLLDTSVLPEAPPAVLEFGKTVKIRAEAYEPETFDWDEWAIGDNLFACARQSASRPNLFMVVDVTSTGEAIPGFGISGGPLANSTLTVKVMDWITHQPIQDAIVYVGNYSSTGAVNTDSNGIAQIPNLTGPVTLTIVGPAGSTYSYITIYDLNASYVSVLLRDPVSTPATFTLWGSVNNLGTANSGWVHLPNVDRDDLCNFDIHHAGGNGPNDPDPLNNTSANAVPDNYSYQFPQAASGITYGFTAFDTNGASGDNIFTNLADWQGQINPSGSPLNQQVDLTFPASPRVFSPIKYQSAPSTITLPSGLSNPTDAFADVTCFSHQLTLGVEPLVGYGDTTPGTGSFTYGVTYGWPQNIEVEWFSLRVGAEGQYGTGDEWSTAVTLNRLDMLPSKYETTLPPVPRVIDPVLGQQNTSPPSQILFENSFMGKKGFYIAFFVGQSQSVPQDAFFWLLVKPVPSSGSSVQMILPTLPSTHAGPATDMVYLLEMHAIARPNFDWNCWFMPFAKGLEDPSSVFLSEEASNEGGFIVP